jgi:hypothetical protein
MDSRTPRRHAIFDQMTERSEVPAWVVERIAEANELSREEAERLAARRSEAASRQAALSDALDRLDLPALAEGQRSRGDR